MSGSNNVLVVMPAYNEQDVIGQTLLDLQQHCPWTDVVVVSDGSDDETVQRAREVGVPVLALPFNLGIGGAVQTGFIYGVARGYDVIAQVDADGQHPAEELAAIVGPVLEGQADVVVGSRFLGSGDFRATRARRLGIRVLSRVVSWTVRQRMTDPTSGFRAYSIRAAEHIAMDYPYDYPEPEALVHLRREGFRLQEVPVVMRERAGGASSIGAFVAVRYMTKVVLAIVASVLRPDRHRSSPNSAYVRRGE